MERQSDRTSDFPEAHPGDVGRDRAVENACRLVDAGESRVNFLFFL